VPGQIFNGCGKSSAIPSSKTWRNPCSWLRSSTRSIPYPSLRWPWSTVRLSEEAAEEASFSLSEVKIGLVPAAISPYVIRKIGESKAREYFLTGSRMSARRAAEIGLVNEVVPRERLESRIDELVHQLLSSGPEAIANCKELIRNVPGMSFAEAKTYTARMIANLRVSEEGQEGMAAFFEKRKPLWAREAPLNEQGSKK